MTDKAREFATKLWKRGTEVAKQQTRILVLQGEVARLRDQKNRLYLQMGQKVYALFEKDLVKNADLRTFCEQAHVLDLELTEKEEEIEQLRAGAPEEPVEAEVAAEAPVDAPDTDEPPAPPPASVADLAPPPPAETPQTPANTDPGTAFLQGDPPSEPEGTPRV